MLEPAQALYDAEQKGVRMAAPLPVTHQSPPAFTPSSHQDPYTAVVQSLVDKTPTAALSDVGLQRSRDKAVCEREKGNCLRPLLPATWQCPGCHLPIQAVTTPIILHHDHLEDMLRNLARYHDAAGPDRARPPVGQTPAFRTYTVAQRRFPPTPLCTLCNHRDGANLKRVHGAPSEFSFSPAQLGQLDQSSDKKTRLASAADAWRACELNFKARVAEARRNAIVWLKVQELRSMQPGRARRDLPCTGLDEMLNATTYRQAR